jgi:hypothetical protein
MEAAQRRTVDPMRRASGSKYARLWQLKAEKCCGWAFGSSGGARSSGERSAREELIFATEYHWRQYA